MLNPVALFLYLKPLIAHATFSEYNKVVWKATIISGLVYTVFILTGDAIFTDVFGINFNSFRLFGGIIIAGFAIKFLLHGKSSFIDTKGTLDEVAEQLALPFMVGAGSISVSVLIGYQYTAWEWLTILIVTMMVCAMLLILFWLIRQYVFVGMMKQQFDKILTIVFRLNSFLMGAVGIDMIITAIRNLFLS